jgi:hypothetical protein
MHDRRFLRVAFASLACACALACSDAQPPQTAAATTVPDFSGYWVRPNPGSTRLFHPPRSGGPGPVMAHADDGDYDIGDHTNPILKPHAAEAVKAFGDLGRAGILKLPPWSLCWPSGVLLHLVLGESVQFLQTPEQVTILYQRDHQVRRIYLNRPHTDNPMPTWYGESVGHYEGEDTLVVDTIGHRADTPADKYGTPHSDKMRVIERFVLSPDRRTIDVEFTVEDPETFTTPWSARVTYQRDPGPIHEVVCAENNRDAATGAAQGTYPIPIAARPDF